MDRIIKFRGKRIDNGEWVYGCLDINPLMNNRCTITSHALRNSVNEVDPASVGQFTGLHDKNSKEIKEIYEGDIVQGNEMAQVQCSWGNGLKDNHPDKRIVWWNADKACLEFNFLEESIRSYGCSGIYMCESSCRRLEVIGNIYENKELLLD